MKIHSQPHSSAQVGAGRRGFTLIELLAVVAIVATLLAAVSYNFGQSSSARRRAATDQVLAMVSRARSQAIANAEPVALVFARGNTGRDDAGRKVALFRVSEGSSGEWLIESGLGQWEELPAKVGFSDEEVSSGRFNIYAQPSTLTFRDRDNMNRGALEAQGAPFLVFSSTGSLLYPRGNNSVATIGLGEGIWENGEFRQVTQADADGSRMFAEVTIRRLSGRPRVDRP